MVSGGADVEKAFAAKHQSRALKMKLARGGVKVVDQRLGRCRDSEDLPAMDATQRLAHALQVQRRWSMSTEALQAGSLAVNSASRCFLRRSTLSLLSRHCRAKHAPVSLSRMLPAAGRHIRRRGLGLLHMAGIPLASDTVWSPQVTASSSRSSAFTRARRSVPAVPCACVRPRSASPVAAVPPGVHGPCRWRLVRAWA